SPRRAASQGQATLRGLLRVAADPGPGLDLARDHQDRHRVSLEGQPGPGSRFRLCLLLGAPSCGGGVVASLRSSLVGKHRWLDDTAFVELLSISQTLPGLNATHMAILVGDRLRGTPGAAAAICGICLPGALVVVVGGMLY